MNKTNVSNIINVLNESNDKAVILKALVKLRTDVVKDTTGIILFRECGGIPSVVQLLSRPAEKILEVAISILGNACTESESCKQAIDIKIIPPLLSILKSVPNPIIQCRACRLLGNIGRENKQKLLDNSTVIAQSLGMILEESGELQTILMAARAARILSNEKQFLLDFIKFNCFKIFIKLLIKHIKSNEGTSNEDKNKNIEEVQPREKYFEEIARQFEGVRSDIFDMAVLKNEKKSNEFYMPTDKTILDLTNEILKCIQSLSELQTFAPIHECIGGLTCFIFLAQENSPFRSISLKILSNFAKNISSIEALNAADAITVACELLTSKNIEKPLSPSEEKHCLNVICMLAGDACNRAKIRRSGALKELLDRVKRTKYQIDVALILYTLNNFQYDHLSMSLLLREGLVGVLIKELHAYLNSSDKYRKEKCEEKKRTSRKRRTALSTKSSFKTPKIWSDIFGSKSSRSGSPNECNSISPSSPCSSGGFSPSPNYQYDKDFDSDTYSPVCSDDEDHLPLKIEKNNDVLELLAISSKTENNDDSELSDGDEDDDNLSSDNLTTKILLVGNIPTNIIDIIDNLLLRTSLQLKNRSDLCKPETLKTIIQAINVFGVHFNGFGTILCNILSDSEFFVSIIKQDVIHSAYLMTKTEKLKPGGDSFIDTLTCVGESGYGRGELTRLLMKGESNAQKKAAIAICFIIRTPRILYPFLSENGALYILMNTILNKNDESRFEGIDGLTALSQILGIKIPHYDLKEFNNEHEFDEATNFDEFNQEDKPSMEFILHRGESEISIKFSKKIISDNSEVFNSMLNSNFKESNENQVHISNYTVNGLKYFLNLIYLSDKNKLWNIPPIYNFNSILEAHELSRMYILENIEKKLFELIISRLSKSTCLKTFEYSLRNVNPELSELVINYYLSSNLSSADKVELFVEADYSEYSKEWNNMIIDAILVKCQNKAYE